MIASRTSRARMAGAVVVLALFGTAARAASVRDCVRLVIGDPLSDAGGGPRSAACDVDLLQPPNQNSSVLGGLGAAFLAHVAAAPGPELYFADIEADPSGLGNDPNGNPGRGVVWRLETGTGNMLLVADGTNCGTGVTNCGPQGVFVDPIGLAWSDARTRLVVVDLDADPTGLGLDSHGFAGHGAIFAVDTASGRLDLVADGSNYPAGLPGGVPSIFEDPIAVDFAADGTLYVLDQLARPSGSTGAAGAVFRVDVATGAVTLVSTPQVIRGPRDIAVEPAGTILLVDTFAGTGGTGLVVRMDPGLPPASNVVDVFEPEEFVEPTGIVVEGNGLVHVSDASADPLALGNSGALFAIDPFTGAATTESSTVDYGAPWTVGLVVPGSLDSATPAAGDAGTTLVVHLVGGAFVPTPSVDFGPGITVDFVTWISSTELDVGVTIAPGAAVGLRDVRIDQGLRTYAFHCELFEVRPRGICPPNEPVGDSLRVRKLDGGDLELTWDAVSDSCMAGYRVRRAASAEPATRPGTWPSDPELVDATADDLDGRDDDLSFVEHPRAGANEYFLVTTVNSIGQEGPSGSYGN